MVKLAVFGIVLALLGVEFKQIRPEYAGIISVLGCTMIFLSVCSLFSNIISEFTEVMEESNIESQYMTCIIKITGTAYLSEYSGAICRDAGFMALSSQIEMFAKLYMLTVSLPIVKALLNTVCSLWG